MRQKAMHLIIQSFWTTESRDLQQLHKIKTDSVKSINFSSSSTKNESHPTEKNPKEASGQGQNISSSLIHLNEIHVGCLHRKIACQFNKDQN